MGIEGSNWLRLNCRFAGLVEAKGPPKTVSIAIFRKKGGQIQVLVGKRKRNPFAGAWALPGGHVDEGEKLREAAARELEEETGVAIADLMFIDRSVRRADDPERYRIDSIFAAMAPEDAEAEASSDLAEVAWVPVERLPELAFDHDTAIKAALAIVLKKDKTGKIEATASSNKLGTLIVFEGADGAGKSSLTERLVNWLDRNGYAVTHTKWNSSDLLEDAIDEAKKKRQLTPILYCLLHASDMIQRYNQIVRPALERNEFVICDRYVYTSVVRDSVRGIDPGIHKIIYKGFRVPDLLVHCSVPVSVAVTRTMADKGMTYYGSGMDLGLAPNKEESCIKYQEMVNRMYERLLPKQPNYYKLNTTQPIKLAFRELLGQISRRFDVLPD